MRTSRMVALSLSLAVLALSACRTGSPYDMERRDATGATLVVEDQNFEDMDIYAVSGGLATRVGTVTGLSTQSFFLHQSLINGEVVRIIGTPIGGNGRASSGNLNVSPGSTIRFTIATELRASHATIE
jgi:hypothetical protein